MYCVGRFLQLGAVHLCLYHIAHCCNVIADVAGSSWVSANESGNCLTGVCARVCVCVGGGVEVGQDRLRSQGKLTLPVLCISVTWLVQWRLLCPPLCDYFMGSCTTVCRYEFSTAQHCVSQSSLPRINLVSMTLTFPALCVSV